MDSKENKNIWLGILSVIGIIADIFGATYGIIDLFKTGMSINFLISMALLIMMLFICTKGIEIHLPNLSIAGYRFIDCYAVIYGIVMMVIIFINFQYFYLSKFFSVSSVISYIFLLLFSLVLFVIPQIFAKNSNKIFKLIGNIQWFLTLIYIIAILYHLGSSRSNGSILGMLFILVYSSLIASLATYLEKKDNWTSF